MTFTPLKPEVTQKLLEQRQNDRETQQWAGEVMHFFDKDGKVLQKTRYILLTECCFYVFVKEKMRGSYKLRILESHIDLSEISAVNNEFSIKFKGNTQKFVFPETSSLYMLYIKQIKNMKWAANSKSIGNFDNLINTKAAKDVPEPKTRPSNLLLFRYIASSISRKIEIEPNIVTLFNTYDESPSSILKFHNFNTRSPTPAFFALSLETQIKNIKFDRFSPDNLGLISNWILTSPNRAISLDFMNYDDANFKGISQKKSSLNRLSIIRFNNCRSQFLSKFFDAVKPVNFPIESLVFQNIKFALDSAQKLQLLTQSSPIFSSIASLSIVDCKCLDTSFYEFVCQLAKTESLRSIQIEKCDIDICDFVSEMARTDSLIQHISLRKNRANTIVGHEDAVLGSSLLHLDAGDCDWASEAFIAFLSSICRRNRRHPLALSIDHSKIDVQWNEVLENLPLESLVPVITELDLSYNDFDTTSFELLLKFIDTQTPLLSHSNHSLLHLALNHCWNDFTKSAAPDCIEMLTSFFESRELWGLEICGVPPSLSFLKITNLHSLNIGGSYYDATSIDTLNEFIQQSASIAELGVDNVQTKDVNSLLQFYLSLSQNPKLLALDQPTVLYKNYSQYNEVKKIQANLTNKRQFSNTHQRLSLFLSLTGDFSTRVVQAAQLEDRNDEIGDTFSNKPDSLLDAKFSNPIPSLFTLASLTNVDVSVDPIAAMVTEYVATSGRFGIVPPTAPPPEPSNQQFKFPSIFSTMQLQNEIENDGDFDFNPDSSKVKKTSISLVKKMKMKLPTLSLDNNNPLWNDKSAMLSYIPLPLRTSS